MIMTVMVMFIAALLTTVIFADGIAGLPLASHAQAYQAALQAANAGVEDYINRLDSNASYYTLTADPNNPALSGWTAVPGTSVGEWYRYSVNNTNAAQTGLVHLVVSGAAGADPATSSSAVIRTIDVGIEVSGFTSFLYWTNYEIIAPTISGLSQKCAVHAWEPDPYQPGQYGPDPNYCQYQGTSEMIFFTTNDHLNGPVASNDEFHICGSPTFGNPTYPSWQATSAYDQNPQAGGPYQYGGAGAYYADAGCINSPVFYGSGTEPVGVAQMNPPTTNRALGSDTAASDDGGGCLYTGPITVVFSGTTMSVTVPTGSTASGPSGVSCQGSNIPLPPNGILYDQTSAQCGSTTCKANVSVSGSVGAQVTVGSDNNITIVGNLTDADNMTGTDVIGLSATNNIIVEHGTSCRPYGTNCLPNLTIDAAMLALNGSFYVNNWTSGSPMGTLTVNGSIAQDYRGPVGTFYSDGSIASGYQKNYSWDSRLRFIQPPYFTSPTLPSWTKVSFTECTPVAAPTATSC